MSLLLLIFLFIIGYYVLWPLLRTFFFFRNIKKRFDPFQNSTESRSSTAHGRSRAPRKKIGRDVGEYVKFEEIDSNDINYKETVNDNDGHLRIETEEQTVDIEWEEIK